MDWFIEEKDKHIDHQTINKISKDIKFQVIYYSSDDKKEGSSWHKNWISN